MILTETESIFLQMEPRRIWKQNSWRVKNEMIQFHLRSKHLIIHEEKKKYNFLNFFNKQRNTHGVQISRTEKADTILMRHNFKRPHSPLWHNNLNLTTSLETEQSTD